MFEEKFPDWAPPDAIDVWREMVEEKRRKTAREIQWVIEYRQKHGQRIDEAKAAEVVAN